MVRFLSVFWVKLFLVHIVSLITCHLDSYITKFLILFHFFVTLSTPCLRQHQTFHRPSDDSLLVPTSPPPPAPTIKPGFPIVIHKGILSTCNFSPHYTNLSYHRLINLFIPVFRQFLLYPFENL